MVTRALPLLLLFMTFLFINAEVWQVAATLDGGLLWVTVLLFAFSRSRSCSPGCPRSSTGSTTRSTVERGERCRGTPLGGSRAVAGRDDHGTARRADEIHGLEKANLLLVLIVAQALQVLLLSVSVFAFFVVFGAVIIPTACSRRGCLHHPRAAVGHQPVGRAAPGLGVLAAFSGLYFTVYAVTDETYRDQFFTELKAELERPSGCARSTSPPVATSTPAPPSRRPSWSGPARA